ncbi:MAG: hypothetical protein AAGA37_07995 [Actinomycetota bacterium]
MHDALFVASITAASGLLYLRGARIASVHQVMAMTVALGSYLATMLLTGAGSVVHLGEIFSLLIVAAASVHLCRSQRSDGTLLTSVLALLSGPLFVNALLVIGGVRPRTTSVFAERPFVSFFSSVRIDIPLATGAARASSMAVAVLILATAMAVTGTGSRLVQVLAGGSALVVLTVADYRYAMGVAVGFCLLALVRSRRFEHLIVLICVPAFVVGLWWSLFAGVAAWAGAGVPQALLRTESADEVATLNGRAEFWDEYLGDYLDSPVERIMVGNTWTREELSFLADESRFENRNSRTNSELVSAHSSLLDQLGATGLVGVGLLLSLVLRAARAAISHAGSARLPGLSLAIGGLLVLGGVESGLTLRASEATYALIVLSVLALEIRPKSSARLVQVRTHR